MIDRPYLCREWLRDDARTAVLEALGAWAANSGLLSPDGWKDQDLPALFSGIDEQVDRVIERSGLAMPDEPYPEAFVQRTREQLVAVQRRPRR